MRTARIFYSNSYAHFPLPAESLVKILDIMAQGYLFEPTIKAAGLRTSKASNSYYLFAPALGDISFGLR